MYAETGLMFPYFQTFPSEVQQFEDFCSSQEPNASMGSIISEYDLGGEGDLFKAPQSIIEEPLMGLDPMTAAISMISCAEDTISPQGLKVSDLETSFENEQLLSEVFYECKKDLFDKDAIDIPFAELLDMKTPIVKADENLTADENLVSQGSFQKSISSESLTSMEWIHGAPMRPNFIDFGGMDFGAVYGMRRAYSEGDIKTLGPSQIPSYPGGLNLQHSIEYWLTLDLLSSNNPNINRPCTAVRVLNSGEADVIFVPFFSSLSYNRHSKVQGKEKISLNRMLQDKVVDFLKSRDEWKRRGGKDHVIVAHHPNSMLDAREKLGSAMFVLADFGRYRAEIANIGKDVIAPYKHMVQTIGADNSPSFRQRDTLVYFQGAIYRKDGGEIRQNLYNLLKDEKDVHFTFGSIQANGVREAGRGMASSKFCLNIAGDTPSSNRLFDAIASHCIPVIISDEIELPFEDVLDYSEFCVFVNSSDAVKKGYLLYLLRGMKEDQWTKMWERIKVLGKHFGYQYPSQTDDAVDMIWQAVSRKVSSMRLKDHRDKRYHRSQLFLKDQMS